MQKLLHFCQLKGAARRCFAKRETTTWAFDLTLCIGFGHGTRRADAAVAAVVFFHHARTGGARGGEGGVVAWDGVAVVFLGFLHHAPGHLGDVLHEGYAREQPFFHLRQLEFPVAGEVGAGKFFHTEAAQQRHQLEGLGGGDEFAPFAQHVFLVQQTFDDGRAGGWRAQAFFLHGFAQFVVFDVLASAFHRAEQGGFGEARRWAGFQALGVGFRHLGLFTSLELDQDLARLFVFVLVDFFAINGLPTGFNQHAASGFEVLRLPQRGHLADAGGVHELCGWVKHRDEAAHHEVVELLLGVRQATGRFQRGDDGKVIADLAVVKHLFAGLDVALGDGGFGERCQVAHAAVGQHLHGVFDGGQVVLGQVLGVGTRVGQGFVALVQALRQREGGFRREAKAAVGLALQGGQVEQAWAAFAAGFALLGDGRALLAHRVGNRLRFAQRPDTVFLDFFVVGMGFVAWVEPFAAVSTCGRSETGVDFPVVAADEFADQFFALDHHAQGGGLHPTHRGEEKTAVA